MAAEPAQVAGSTPSEHVAEKEKGVPLKPDVLFHIGKFAITNSMLVTWFVAAAIIVFAQTATRNIKPVPSGGRIFGNGWWKASTTFSRA